MRDALLSKRIHDITGEMVWACAIRDGPRSVVRYFFETLQVVVRDRHGPRDVNAHPIRGWPRIDDDDLPLLIERLLDLLRRDEAFIGRARGIRLARRRSQREGGVL